MQARRYKNYDFTLHDIYEPVLNLSFWRQTL